MRILFLTNMYPPHDVGGYEQWCQEVAESLKKRRHDIHILTSRYGVKDEANNHSESGITRTLYLQSDLNYYRPIDFLTKYSAQEKANLRELRQLLDHFHPEIILVWGMWQLSWNIPYWAEQWLPGRVAYYIASYWPTDPDPHSAYWQLPANHFVTEQIKRPLRLLALAKLRQEKYPPTLKFEHVACCSEYVRNTLIQAGKLSNSAEILYGGVDPEPFSRSIPQSFKPNEPLRLVYFGRLIADKGVHTAIEAIGLLKQKSVADRVRLTILGSGHPEYEAHLRDLVNRLGVQSVVDFVGKIPREDIPRVLKNFDVFLFTSLWAEPFGRTIIEAMLAGLAVIGTDVGGSREIFRQYDDDSLFQSGDAIGLAGRIERLLGSPELRQRLAHIGRDLALERFSMKCTVDAIENYLQRVVSSEPSIRL